MLNTSTLNILSPYNDLIDDETLKILIITFRMGLDPLLATCGIVAAVINILVFRRIGVSDRIMPSLLFLSVSDGLVCLVTLAGALCLIIWLEAGSHSVSCWTFVLYFYLLPVKVMTIQLSASCTAVISVVRCCCVTLPFRVKTLFAARRQVAAVVMGSLPSIASIAYTMTTLRVDYEANPKHNNSTVCNVTADLNPNFGVDLFRGIATYLTMFVVFVCLIILIIHLKRSDKFRRQQNVVTLNSNTLEAHGRSSHITARSRQVIKMASLVAAIFIVCNVPVFLFVILRQTVPGFDETGGLKNSYETLLISGQILTTVNASINIIAYLKSNSRYRFVFRELFCGPQD